MSDISSIINSLQKLNEDKIKTLTLPYSKIEVTLEPFKAKHNTMVNSSVVAGNDGTYTLKFSNLLKELFDDLLKMEGGYTYKDLPLVDVHYLTLQLRNSFSDKIVINLGEEGLEEHLDLEYFIEKFENLKPNTITEKTVHDIDGVITAYLKQPNFKNFVKYDEIILASHKKYEKTNKEELVKDALAFTLLKFIDRFDIKVDNEIQTIVLDDISPFQRKEIMNQIPNEMYSSITDSITEITDPIEALITHDESKITMDQTVLMDTDNID